MLINTFQKFSIRERSPIASDFGDSINFNFGERYHFTFALIHLIGTDFVEVYKLQILFIVFFGGVASGVTDKCI